MPERPRTKAQQAAAQAAATLRELLAEAEAADLAQSPEDRRIIERMQGAADALEVVAE